MDVGAPTSLAEEENKFMGNGGRRTNSGGGALALRRLAARQERERGKLIGLGVREVLLCWMQGSCLAWSYAWKGLDQESMEGHWAIGLPKCGTR